MIVKRAVAAPDKKLIHNAELGLTVVNVRAAAEEIRRLTELNHGEIDKLEITATSGGFLSDTLQVRVPASGLENAPAAFRKVAVRTEREHVGTRDVTREFYDNEAHTRNLRAEEQQYLAIMKQAHTVKDTLEVSEKLSDVRDRIERLQTQVQLLTHERHHFARAVWRFRPQNDERHKSPPVSRRKGFWPLFWHANWRKVSTKL